MNNKNEAWRLEDESGKKIGMKPDGDIKMFFNGKEIGTMQSITFANGSTIQGSPYTIGDNLPRGTAIRGQRYHQFQQEYLGIWGDAEIGSPAPVRTRTIDMQVPDIQDVIWREIIEYQSQMNGAPEYLSLNKEAYESFWLQGRQYRSEYDSRPRDLSGTRFAGIEVMCNPLQEQHVLALGNAEREMQRSLYHEQP